MGSILAENIKEIVNSGETVDLTEFKKRSVSGCGVGNVSSNILIAVIPIIAAVGIKTTKIINRQDAFDDDIIKKLESISGFSSGLPKNMFLSQLRKCGISIAGCDSSIVPKCLKNRPNDINDLATVLMCKELAKGAYNIVFDIAVGKGQPIKNMQEATVFSEQVKNIAKEYNRKAIVFISQPFKMTHKNYGNMFEMQEIIDVLNGNINDGLFYDSCVYYASTIISNIYNISTTVGMNMVEKILNKQLAYDIFKDWIRFQQGDLAQLHPMKTFEHQLSVKSDRNGIIEAVNVEEIKKIVEKYKNIGIVFNKTVKEHFSENETLFTIYSNKKDNLETVANTLSDVITLSFI